MSQRCVEAVTGLEPLPEGISRYGAIPLMRQRASHGITRRLTRQRRTSRVGLRRYERVCTRDHSREGQFLTRQGISLGLLLEDRLTGSARQSAGQTFPLTSLRRRRGRTISSSHPWDEMVGVWSLRILKNSDGFR